MHATTLESFRRAALDKGFDEVLVREWAPGSVMDTHTHPFAVQALVVQGELWLTCHGQTRHLRAGDTFALERDLPHDERYGPEGATYWVARRNG